MLKKTVTYTNFNGEKVTKDFFFHFSKAELMDMKLIHGDGLEGRLREMLAKDDKVRILKEFRELLRQTVGERSEDGERFIKTPEIANAFMESPAFDEIYGELLTNTGASVEFIRGVVPSDLRGRLEENSEVQALVAKAEANPVVVTPEGPMVPTQRPKIFGEMTEEELAELSPEEFEKLFAQVSADEELTAHQKGFYDFSRTELLAMSDEEFTALVGPNPRKWDKVQRVVAMQRFADARKNKK